MDSDIKGIILVLVLQFIWFGIMVRGIRKENGGGI